MALRLTVCLLGGAVLLTACGSETQSDSRPAPQQAIVVAPVAAAPPEVDLEVTDYTDLPPPPPMESGSKPVWKSQIFARLPSEVLIVDRTRRADQDEPQT